MADIGGPQFITTAQAEGYASQAGFNNTLVPKSQYAPGTWSQLQTIVAIAHAESQLDIHAYNPNDPYGGSYGVLQINGSHFHAGGTTQNAALNPQSAFQYAYMLSGHGSDFTAWGTFTNGAYKQYIPFISGNTVFKLPLNGWWLFPRIDNLGQPDSFGGFPKPDSNIQLPDNFPIVNLLPGTVSGTNLGSDAWGASVTIRLDSPINSLADHFAFLHLADVTVKVGDHVNTGDLIGHNGGNHAAGSQKVPLGVALYHGENYGHDGWQYETQANLTGNGKLNIVPLLDAAKTGKLTLSVGPASPLVYYNSSNGSSGTGVVNNIPDLIGNLIAPLQPSDPVAKELIVIDDLMAIVNPFPNNIDSSINNGFGVLQWLNDFLYNLFVVDATAIMLRTFFILLGFYICFKVFDNILNISGAVKGVTNLGLNAAKLGLAVGV